ncbi:MAG: DedA family protein [Candidatus Paceibacterota bacterium]|jgi:membrane protein DedA with SNARE-associated domain
MIELVLSWIANIVIVIINSTGYLGIFLLMALESANIPVPSEIIMPFSGFLVFGGNFSFWLVVLAGTFGNLFGSLVSFRFAEWIVASRSKFKLISHIFSEKFLYKSHVWFEKYGYWSVFFSRLLPVARTFISLPAGLAKMNIWKFSILTLFGSFIWSWILTYIGLFLGVNWHTLGKYFRQLDLLILVIVLILFFWWLYNHNKRH